VVEVIVLIPKHFSYARRKQKITNRFNDFGVLADLNDKTNPSYWHFYYDPRYCGLDPEAWMEKMAAR
jgi:hypothetical protein